MKRFFLIVLIILIFTGCATDQPETPETTSAPTEPTVAEEPGIYDPDSLTEKQTNGAVRVYPLGVDNCSGVELIDGNLLLFLTGETTTRLRLLSGKNLSEVKTVQLKDYAFPSDANVCVNEQGIAYFDSNTNSVVFLNPDLLENRWITLPEDIQGMPVLSEDWHTIYYCTDSAIRGLDIETGISRLVRGEYECQWQYPQQLCWGDQVLAWYMAESELEGHTSYVSVQTGEILYTSDVVTELETYGEWYYACIQEDTIPDYLFGYAGEEGAVLKPMRKDVSVLPALELGALITAAYDDTGCDLDYYDLESGKRTSSVRLENVFGISDLAVDTQNGWIWLLDYDAQTNDQTLFQWDPAKSGVTDSANYTDRRYTAEDPDVHGLEECQALVKELNEQYGVEIVIWKDAKELEPWDYKFEIEYKVSAYEENLPVLEQALSRFPEGFLQQLAGRTESGTIHIVLVRNICGDAANGTLSSVVGIQYWLDGDAYIGVNLSDPLEQTIYHEMFHIMDTYVLSTCVVYDNWSELNPDGFEYDYDYLQNQYRTDYAYLEDDQRAFIDMYSMSFPSEDRARIMEYAMLPDSEAYFQSEVMQQKLYQLCYGIRVAFELENYEEALPWEAYLAEPLVPVSNG